MKLFSFDLLTNKNRCAKIGDKFSALKRYEADSMLHLSSLEICRSVQDIGKDLQNSPQSGCPEAEVGANGNSRNRVKMCQHLKGILYG